MELAFVKTDDAGFLLEDRSRKEYGHYMVIGRINRCGCEEFFGDDGEITEEEMERIDSVAADKRRNFMERWNTLSALDKFREMISFMTADELHDIGEDYEAIVSRYFEVVARRM